MLVRERIKHSVQDQIILLNQVTNGELNVTFEDKLTLPMQTELVDIFNMTGKMINESKNSLIVEIQVFLFLTVIQGIDAYQAINLLFKDWKHIEQAYYQGTNISIMARNKYCDTLIKLLRSRDKRDKLFHNLDLKNVFCCLNLYLVMNGFEYVFNPESLRMSFGRFHYLRHGRIRGVREFLKEYFSVESHIELLVKLKLVDSIYYNTMMRN